MDRCTLVMGDLNSLLALSFMAANCGQIPGAGVLEAVGDLLYSPIKYGKYEWPAIMS